MRLYLIMKDFEEKNDYITVEDLMNKYNVSKRTIQNDLSYLIRISPRKGFTLHMQRGQGYLLEITNEQLFNEFVDTLKEDIFVPTRERPAHILSYLSIQNGYISMDNIADMFQVSKTVIKNDMKEVEELAKGYHFVVERKHHYGIRLHGDEKDMKKYLVEEYLNQNVIVQTAINDVVKDFQTINDYFVSLLENEKLNMNYNELMNVVEYLKVMVYRSYMIKEKDDLFSYDDSSLHRVVQALATLLKEEYQISFNDESIKELIDVLSKNIRVRVENIAFSEELEKDIEIFLKKVDQTYETSFLQDEDFKKMLFTHVTLLVDRLRNKISYKNELANELSITYPMIFNIGIQFCEMLQEKYNVQSSFDEIGFVAMHFAGHMEKEKQDKLQSFDRIGVVCSSGGGSAYMIKMQIESLFPNAEVQTFSFLAQKDLETYQPDLIFTVMPLSLEIQVPIIYIKELLKDNDLLRIKQVLQMDDYDAWAVMNENPLYYSFFSKEFFKVVDDDNYEHLIQTMAEELENQGYGKKGYTQMVLQRESYVSTIYKNGVCIPHPIETDALKNMISVSILKKPFIWNEKEVKIVFMICLKKEHIEMYKTITRKLYHLMHENRYLNRMIKEKSFEDMMLVMKKLGGDYHE
ncbi:PTS sugar transporter subunit IIA [Allocoprobacillus halotolerans]|uniref:PTS sugar transporter subunit IIA n=1 Tax=Allocoprobacillus halotolerans TaxID=2944914 RepID=A0ABY5I5K3_9FIRM|nr:PTS sugar transporter subunit IIA [Allocoprobacillus halotolerans]UTY40042.1 PTS sugar transporter subunit IIA [Allocoprobacillus halotolerans]